MEQSWFGSSSDGDVVECDGKEGWRVMVFRKIPNMQGWVTVYGANGGSTTTNTAADGSVTSSVSFVDGGTKSSTDQVGNVTSYDKGTHALNGGGLFSLTTAANGTQTSKRFSDQLGRSFRAEYADGAYSEMEYFGFVGTVPVGSRGKLKLTKDADEVALAGKGSHVAYEYDGEGDRVKVSSKVAGGQTVVQTSDSDVVSDSFAGVAYRNRSWVNGVLTSTSLREGTGYRSKSVTLAGTSTSEKSLSSDGSWTVSSTGADGVQSRQFYADGLMKSSVVFESGSALPAAAPGDVTAVADTGFVSGMASGHDGFGRVTSQTDSRTGIYTMTLLENGAVETLTDAGSRVTSYVFDEMGRTIEVNAPDTLDKDGGTISNRTFTSFYATGQVKGVWGDQTYARFNVYDSLNRLSELRTYQGLAHGVEPTVATAGFAKTNWNYDAQRGWLDSKRYDDGKGTDYTRTAAGRLKTRVWARKDANGVRISTNYSYDAGMLTSTDYTDLVTAPVSYSYDGFGRQSVVTQGVGAGANVHVYQYDDVDSDGDPVTLQLEKETVSYGSSLSRELVRSYDSILRPSGWELKTGAGVVDNAVGYGYDSAGRLGGVSTSYPAAAGAEFAYAYKAKSGGLLESVTGPAHTVTNSYEATRNVLDVKTNATLGGSPVTLSAFDYGVNDLGQRDDVDVSGTAFVAPYTRGFKYDAKGQVVRDDHSTDNAKDRAFAFDGIGNRLKSADSLTLPVSNNYVANALNQYSTALGIARPVASHDDDGNLVDDGVKTYVWDGENRLLSVSDSSGVLVSYTYDYLSRRIIKNETSGSNVTFVYDGWNPVAVYGGSGLSKIYTWGMDLSGSTQGAGGVGGLLAVKEASGGDSYYPTYDGNGNVSEYLDSSGAVVAHYEYDALGRTTVNSGAKVGDFVHRFSTKQLDNSSGLYYYGYRYYQPEVGRWLGRDPAQENGGIHLYLFVKNESVGYYDLLGLLGFRQSRTIFATSQDNTSEKNTKQASAKKCVPKLLTKKKFLQLASPLRSKNSQQYVSGTATIGLADQGFTAVGSATAGIIGSGNKIGQVNVNPLGQILCVSKNSKGPESDADCVADVSSLGAWSKDDGIAMAALHGKKTVNGNIVSVDFTIAVGQSGSISGGVGLLKGIANFLFTGGKVGAKGSVGTAIWRCECK